MSAPDARVPLSQPAGRLRSLDSCSSTWLFDEARRLCRRLPRGAAVDAPTPPGAWMPYHRVEIDDSRACFAVVLDPTATRVFRCWLHRDPCPRCQAASSTELGVDELRSLVEWWKRRLGIADPPLGRAPGAGSQLLPRRRHRQGRSTDDLGTER